MASISENPNGTFRIRVYVGDDKDGKPIIKTKTYTPSAPNLSYAKLTKEVEAVAEQFEQDIRNASPRALEEITFERFVPIFLETKKPAISPNTYAFYSKVLDEHLIPLFGKRKMKDIRTYDVQAFINKMARKECEGKEDAILAGTTVKRYTTVLRSLLTTAYKMEYIDADVGISRRLEFPKTPVKELEVYTPEEVQGILTALESEHIRIRAIIETALFTGCRRGELVGLKWSDIDFDKKKLSVKRSVYKLQGQEPAEKEPKSRSSIRTIGIPERLVKTLQEYHAWQRRHSVFVGSDWQELDYVFTEENGRVMHPHTPTKQFDHFLKRHNLRHIKFHGLRHTSATLLLACGCDVKTVSARLGHADLDVTNIYLHALEATDRLAADTFDQYFGRKEK